MHVTGVPAITTPQAAMFLGQRRWQRSDQVSTLMWDLQVKAKCCCREYWRWFPEGDTQPLELHCGGSWFQEAVEKASRQQRKLPWFCMCCLPEETGLNHLRLFKKKKRVLLTPVKRSDSFKKTNPNSKKKKKQTKQNKQKHKTQGTLRKHSYEKAAETRKTTSGNGRKPKLLEGKRGACCSLRGTVLPMLFLSGSSPRTTGSLGPPLSRLSSAHRQGLGSKGFLSATQASVEQRKFSWCFPSPFFNQNEERAISRQK